MKKEIKFQPLKHEHLEHLLRWMQSPHITPWWGDGIQWTESAIKEKYTPYTCGWKLELGQKKAIYPYIIYVEGSPVGYIQYYNALDFAREGFDVKKYPTQAAQSLAALDFYIGEQDYLGKGLGERILKEFLHTHVFAHFDACLVDPDRSNKSALKTYSKAGFLTIDECGSSVVMVSAKQKTISPIVLLGSSRGDGGTSQAIQSVFQSTPAPIVYLSELDISYYDYSHANAHDDFMTIAQQMVMHNPIILATPVYWYTMSAMMKTFIDRWSDLLEIRKDIGRRLAGKELYVITSYANSLPRGFEEPFSQTCDYFEIEYKGCYYYYNGNDSYLRHQNHLQAEKMAAQIWNTSPTSIT